KRVGARHGDQARGRLETCDTAVAGGETDAPARVAAQPERGAARGDDRRLSAAAPAWRAVDVVRIASAAMERSPALFPNATWRAVRLADQDRAGPAPPGVYGCGEGGNVRAQPA